MAQHTPPLHAKGIYQVAAPFVLQSATLYECAAIRDFEDLIQQGVDIWATYYQPVGLTQQNYQSDLAAGANIVTLMADSAPVVRLPDTYINSYPDSGNVPYSQVIISLSLGPLPDALDLTFAKQQIAAAASSVIGLEPTVNVHLAPSTGVVTQAENDANEIARQAAITNRVTDAAKVIQLQAQLTATQTQYNALIELCKAKGVLPST